MEKIRTKKSKWRFIWVIPITMLTFSAIAKVIQLDMILENMANAGMGHMTGYLGYIALTCIIVFLIPKTRRLGFLLVTTYIGGIITAHLIVQDGNPIGIILQTLFWFGAYFEFPEFFKIEKSSILKAKN